MEEVKLTKFYKAAFSREGEHEPDVEIEVGSVAIIITEDNDVVSLSHAEFLSLVIFVSEMLQEHFSGTV